jgi:hypothetical protein
VRRVLVSLPYGDGERAEVVREGTRTMLVASREFGGGTVLEAPAVHRLSHEGVRGGRFVVAGLLPAGAVRAAVVDPGGERVEATCGDGAWLAVVAAGDGREPPVRFDDEAGRPVRPELPAPWPREPVDDATEPCPACGATAWERVVPSDFSRGSRQRGSGPEEPSAVIVCRRCGHEEGEGVWYGFADAACVPPDPAAIERHMQRRRAEQRRIIAEVDFPLYALAGAGRPQYAGWGGRPGHIERATLRHERDGGGEVRVESASPASAQIEDPTDRAREALFDTLPAFGSMPDLSPPARTLWLRARERAHVAVLVRAEPAHVDVAVDDASVAFAAFRRDGGWAIAANLDGARVTATGTDWPLEGLALRPVSDPVTDVDPAR